MEDVEFCMEPSRKGILFPSFIGGFFLLAIGIPYGITNRVAEFIGWTAFDPELSLDSSISYIPIMNVAYFPSTSTTFSFRCWHERKCRESVPLSSHNVSLS